MSGERNVGGQYPLSGVPFRNGPENPYRAVGDEQRRLVEIRNLTSSLGRTCERIVMGLWSNKFPPDPNNSKLSSAVSEVRHSLRVVSQRTFNTHSSLAEVYQGLTEPSQIPFLGDERTWPSFPALADLFSEVDRLYATNFGQSFVDLSVEGGKVGQHIRYLVENAMVIGKWTVEGPPKINGRVIPNVILLDRATKQLTQFDGVVVDKESAETTFEVSRRLGDGQPWWAIEVRIPNRARYISGPRKLESVFQYDVAAYQNKLGKIILDRDGHFSLPACVLFAYLRGSLKDKIHSIWVGSAFIKSWRQYLEDKI
ncbi:MAG: hypothetical protein UX13_C0055G0001, partial [Candidatus Woesebacteria bacterium GW2011_GWB1_45_5]